MLLSMEIKEAKLMTVSQIIDNLVGLNTQRVKRSCFIIQN